MKNYKIALLDKKKIAKDTLEFKFTKPVDFTFTAGQFVQFRIKQGDKIALRSYSLASIPNDDHLEFCIKLLPGGVAGQYFEEAKIHEEMEIQGPVGHFTCSATTPLLLIATGVGLCPLLSIIRDQLENKKTDQPIHLIFGVRYEENIFCEERLATLAKQFSKFTYQLTLSRPGPAWSGLSGRVVAHLPESVGGSHVYICGNGDMVKEARQLLIDRGVQSQQIHFEIF